MSGTDGKSTEGTAREGAAHAAKESGAKAHDEKSPAKKQAEERKETLIAGLIVLAILCALGLWIFHAATSGAEPGQGDRVGVDVGSSPGIGAHDAPVVVVEFSDFECPYCASFASSSFPQVKEEYVDTGKVRFVYKHFPLVRIHPNALPAAQAAACADLSGKFWEYHDVLYARQDALALEDLVGYAGELGIDEESFRRCVEDGERRHVVQADIDAGVRAGITGTPAFLFNGRKVVGALTPEQFAAEVEFELSQAQ